MNALGIRLCLFIVLAQHMMKGIIFGGGSGGVVGLPVIFLFKSYTNEYKGLTAIQIQIYRNIALSSWSLKPLIGIVSDTVSIVGYHKLPYIFITLLGAIVGCILLAMTWPVAPPIATCLLFFIFLACATTDLLTESRYSREINQNTEQGPSITTFVWMGIFVGQIISTVPIGILLEYIPPHILYYIPIAPFILLLLPVYQNWLGDTMCVNTEVKDVEYLISLDEEAQIEGDMTPSHDIITNCCPLFWFYYMFDDDGLSHDVYNASGDELPPASSSDEDDDDGLMITNEDSPTQILTPMIGIKLGKIQREWRPILLAVCIAIISITTSVMGILQVNTNYICIVSLLGSIIMIIGFNVLIGGITARIQTYVMIQNMFSLSISSAEFFFMTDTVEQYAEGPHFSKSFYVIAMGLVASFCAIIGSLTYLKVMQHWKIRSVFYFGNIVSILMGLLNVVFYKRWNKLVGLPDEVFVLGSEALQVIVYVWCSVPVTIMMSQLCTKDMESIMYALLAGSSNLGNSLSQYTGASLLSLLGVNPSGNTGETAQFEYLWLASLVSTLLPIVTLITIPYIIPDKYQTESLLEQDFDHKLRLSIDNHYMDDGTYEDIDKFINEDSDSVMWEEEKSLKDTPRTFTTEDGVKLGEYRVI